MISILTDSTCDLPQELIEKHQIRVVPQYVIWGEEQFRDRVDLQPETFYARLEAGDERPTTAQATEMDFSQAIDAAVEAGATQVLILTVSSAMSGTYQMALNAAEKASVPVEVIDSKGPTMTLGWQVLVAARARDDGLGMAEIVQHVAEVRSKMVQIVGMETLEYLQTGGRIGDAVKWIGALLKVRPVVSINHQTGRVQPVGLARTHKAMVNMMYKKFFDGHSSHRNLRIAVLHGGVLEEAQALAERVKDEYAPVEILLNITGPVLGINTGPGALALCGFAED
jgi:DegV family protein with EDD domain